LPLSGHGLRKELSYDRPDVPVKVIDARAPVAAEAGADGEISDIHCRPKPFKDGRFVLIGHVWPVRVDQLHQAMRRFPVQSDCHRRFTPWPHLPATH
jgi:hypothetical protein